MADFTIVKPLTLFSIDDIARRATPITINDLTIGATVQRSYTAFGKNFLQCELIGNTSRANIGKVSFEVRFNTERFNETPDDADKFTALQVVTLHNPLTGEILTMFSIDEALDVFGNHILNFR